MGKIQEKFTFFLLLLLLPLRLYGDDVPFEVVGGESQIVLDADATAFTFSVIVRLPEGHYLYKDKTQFVIEDSAQTLEWRAEWPETELREDPFLNTTVEVWDTPEVIIPLYFAVGDRTRLPTTVRGIVTLQGCSQTLCYRPVKRLFEFEVSDASMAGQARTALPAPALQTVFADHVLAAMGIAFLGGVVTDFTPCVLPIIPLILLFIGVQKNSHVGRNVLLAFALVIGMAITYVVLGLLAALAGWNLGFVFQAQWFQGILTLFFALMTLALFDVISFTLPHNWQTRLNRMGGKGIRGSMIVGLTIGLVALPCVGPVIAALLLYVANTQDIYRGALYLFAYAMGMGSLFIVAAALYGKGKQWVQGGAWTRFVKKGLGLVFLGVTIYYGTIFIKGLVQSVGPQATQGDDVQVDGWYRDFDAALAVAKESGKPLLVDFRADWCAPCLEMEQTTFKNDQVRAAFASRIIPVNIDCTYSNAQCERLVEEWNVVGFPALLFFDAMGNPLEELHWKGGYIDAEQLLERIERATHSH